MKIFFSASLQGEVNTQIYHKIFSEIEATGYEHVDNEVVKLSREEFAELKNKGREEQIKRYNQKIDAIKKADICIFDVSAHSLSTGFLVNVALDLQKPTKGTKNEWVAHSLRFTQKLA